MRWVVWEEPLEGPERGGAPQRSFLGRGIGGWGPPRYPRGGGCFLKLQSRTKRDTCTLGTCVSQMHVFSSQSGTFHQETASKMNGVSVTTCHNNDATIRIVVLAGVLEVGGGSVPELHSIAACLGEGGGRMWCQTKSVGFNTTTDLFLIQRLACFLKANRSLLNKACFCFEAKSLLC